MRLADTRPPFAGLANLSEAALAALPTPCYLLDEARLRRNGEILLGVQQRTGCKILLAQKAFSNYDLYPVLAPYLAGTEASGLYESRLGREQLPEKEMRLETHFLVSLFVCIIGLLTTVNGNVTYPAVDEPTNWRALGFAFGLFLVLFVLGALWNRIKWIVLQKRNARKKHSTQPRTVINSKKS